jgi:hypothetical protein
MIDSTQAFDQQRRDFERQRHFSSNVMNRERSDQPHKKNENAKRSRIENARKVIWKLRLSAIYQIYLQLQQQQLQSDEPKGEVRQNLLIISRFA